jgi:hypothetical protein
MHNQAEFFFNTINWSIEDHIKGSLRSLNDPVPHKSFVHEYGPVTKTTLFS